MNKFSESLISLSLIAIGTNVFADTWYGTAFSIGDGYTYVTNHHVTNEANTICFRTPNGDAAKVKVINSDRSDDLSLIRANVYSPPLQIGSSQDIKKGMSVLTIGYPVPNIMGFESKVTEGIVNSLSGAGGDTRRVQISAPIQPGNSGGPLLDEKGNVVGVVVSRLGKKFADLTGQHADSVGYAINVARLKALIETTPTLPGYIRPSLQTNVVSRTKLVATVESSIMLVIATDKKESCGEEVDSEIPDFGSIAKSKAQIEKEKQEARQVAILRLEREKREQDERERFAFMRKQEDEKQKIESEDKKLKNKELRSKSLYAASKHWETIDTSPGFFDWKNSNGFQNDIKLIDYSNTDEATILIRRYIADVEKKFSITSQTQESYIYTGLLCECANLLRLDTVLGFAVGELHAETIEKYTDVIVFNTSQGVWQKYNISRWKDKQFSFSIPINSNNGLNSKSKLYMVRK